MHGLGILRGFVETARNFVGSYHRADRLTTVQYPEQRLAPVENARTVPFLVFDGEDPAVGLRCTACTICQQECPPQCISIVKDTVKKADYVGKMQLQPKTFDIDISVCMGCGICAEVCPFDSIKMDQAYAFATSDRFGQLVLHKAQLAKSNAYFRQLHPTDAEETDARRAEDKKKAEAKAAEAKAKAAAASPASATPAAAAASPKPAPSVPTPASGPAPKPATVMPPADQTVSPATDISTPRAATVVEVMS